ncbi:transposase [Arachnia propionica]|uniref:Transposase n=1 Tax=Arachnia propionica TaxID=1750 RepID=A0A3P1T2Y7_9ACTN|nr:transposase [Arachnia propionica]
MLYQSTTGLCEETIDELTCRVADVIASRGMDLSRCRIPLRGQVVACLLILRQDLPQMVVADLLGVSQPTISRIWRRITALLEAVLVFLPGGLAEAIQQHQLILIDGTHVPTGNRPASGQARHNYSGKRKLQCLNVQVASTDRGDLIAVSDPVPGSRHDSKAIALCGWQDLLDSCAATWIADTAYIATTAITPIKKLPRQPRTNHDKDFNTTIARIRVNVEHCIAQLKTWRILSHGYRGPLKELPGIIHLVTNLEILRTYTHNQPRE